MCVWFTVVSVHQLSTLSSSIVSLWVKSLLLGHFPTHPQKHDQRQQAPWRCNVRWWRLQSRDPAMRNGRNLGSYGEEGTRVGDDNIIISHCLISICGSLKMEISKNGGPPSHPPFPDGIFDEKTPFKHLVVTPFSELETPRCPMCHPGGFTPKSWGRDDGYSQSS